MICQYHMAFNERDACIQKAETPVNTINRMILYTVAPLAEAQQMRIERKVASDEEELTLANCHVDWTTRKSSTRTDLYRISTAEDARTM